MKSLVNGCAAAALLMGLAVHAHAEIAVREAPVHTIPADGDEAPSADTAEAPPAQAADKVEATAQKADDQDDAEDQDKTAVKAEVKADAKAKAKAEVAQAPAQAAKAEPAAVKALVEAKAPASLTPEENAFFARLGQRVTDAASAYESYVRRAGAIDPAFSGAGQVQRAVKAGAAYQPVQLEEGVIAYAALIALRDQDFVDGVRAVQNPAFADDLAAHPVNVMQVRGAREAAADVAGVLQAQGDLLIAEGKAITKAAYDIQAQSWSKSPVSDPKAVLDGAKASAGQTRVATVPSKEKLLESLVSAPQPAPGSAPGAGPAPDVARGLALAAMAILGKTGDGEEARYQALLHDSSSEDCLKLAKLNLNQCLAVAGPHYEDVYCAGRHAVSDTGQCIESAAGGAPADAAVQPPQLQTAQAQAPAQARTQAVGQVQTMGPEQAAAYGKAAPPVAEDEDEDVARPAPPAQLAAAPPAPSHAPAPAPAPAPVVIPAPPSAMAALAQAPAPAPAPTARQYAEAPQAPAPAARPYADPPRQYAEAPQAELQYPQPQPQRAEPMPDPRLPRQVTPPPAPSYAPQPQPYSYAQNDYDPPQPPPPQYGRSYAQPAYRQPSYQQPYQSYRQPYPQSQYAPQPYQQPYAAPQPYPQGYAPSYSGQQPYYPQAQGYPSYQGDYYGR